MNTRQANALAQQTFGPHVRATARRGWRDIVLHPPGSLCCIVLGRAQVARHWVGDHPVSRSAAIDFAWLAAFEKATAKFATLATCDLCGELGSCAPVEGCTVCTVCRAALAR